MRLSWRQWAVVAAIAVVCTLSPAGWVGAPERVAQFADEPGGGGCNAWTVGSTSWAPDGSAWTCTYVMFQSFRWVRR